MFARKKNEQTQNKKITPLDAYAELLNMYQQNKEFSVPLLEVFSEMMAPGFEPEMSDEEKEVNNEILSRKLQHGLEKLANDEEEAAFIKRTGFDDIMVLITTDILQSAVTLFAQENKDILENISANKESQEASHAVAEIIKKSGLMTHDDCIKLVSTSILPENKPGLN